MTRQTKSMSTPLARARGLGSAKSGLHHWWHQRVSAVAMVGLVSWMVVLLFSLVDADYQTALNMLAHPVNATVVVLFVAVGLWHASLGLQVVLEDYVANEGVRLIAILAVKMAASVTAILAILSVLKVAL
ncbi:MAG: succinate dehydrogenase, hydrophobic membrane anchor protein [Candidatus Puniceispirillaceae bacterium]